MSSDKNWVCVGTIGAPHGVAGAVRIRAFTERPLALGDFSELRLGPGMEPLRISSLRQGKGNLIARIEGVEGRTEAEALRGQEILVRRAALAEPEEDEFYLVDLEGLTAVDTAGVKIGEVKEAVNYGAGDLVVLALDAPRKGVGKEVVLPFRKRIFPEVNLDRGRVTVALEDWLQEISEEVVKGANVGEKVSK